MRTRTTGLAVMLGAWALGACTPAGRAPPQSASAVAAVGRCDARSVASRPGRDWWREQRWRYADDAAATRAYLALLDGASPWPDWFVPVAATLPAGARFQMALAPGQGTDRPGGFGTYDAIRRTADVRAFLAVRQAWKPRVDRVVIYEVTQPLPVEVGPVGPQVDPDRCRLLPGRWSQLRMTVPAEQRMSYLRVIEVRAIR